MWYAFCEGLEKADSRTEIGSVTSNKEGTLASFRKDLEKCPDEGIPSLEDMESGKLVGAVLPMSERAQTQMRNSIEVIDYLLNQERVVWS
jgi:hypothetical protein